jgi:hypothetical protein
MPTTKKVNRMDTTKHKPFGKGSKTYMREAYNIQVRAVRDTISSIVSNLPAPVGQLSVEDRMLAIITAWHATHKRPVQRRWLEETIAVTFGYGKDRVNTWRIVNSYNAVVNGYPDRRTFAGYYKKWQKILNHNQ